MLIKKSLGLFIVFCSTAFANVQAAEKVSLSGTIEAAFCAQACSVCCPTSIITDTSGEITLQVGNSFVDLEKITGDMSIHHFTGSFYETLGQCGIGECTLFVIEELDAQPVAEAEYDSTTEELTIPSAVIKDTDSRYTLTLRPPFNTGSLVELTEDTILGQTESCVDPGSQCETGLSCVEYYGVAGANGPLFKTCEIPCSIPGASCPTGQSCVTIADGPGQVCVED